MDDLKKHSQESILTNDQQEDGDMNIYFDRQSLLDHHSNLEEDNLFKIHLVQEDEQALEAEKTKIVKNIQEREQEILDVRKNIEMLEKSKSVLVGKQQFLESNMKLKQAGTAHGGKGSGSQK